MSNSEFFMDNYRIILSHNMADGSDKIFLGGPERTCRICDRNHSETTFKMESHTVPEFLGNKRLFSNDECDKCNGRFGLLESDFGEMTLANRTIGGVPRKGTGLPTYKNTSDTLRVQQKQNTLNIEYKVDETGIYKENQNDNSIELVFQSKPYRPLAAFKSLAKIGFMLLPVDRLPAFLHLKAWLQETDLNDGKHFNIYGHGCFISAIPGFKPTTPTVQLFERRTNIDSPFCILRLIFGHFILQSVVPCPVLDRHLVNNKFDFRVIPTTYEADEDHIPLQPAWMELLQLEKVTTQQTWIAKSVGRTPAS